MTIDARTLTQAEDGIGGYMAHPDGPGPRPGVLMAHHAHGVMADSKIGTASSLLFSLVASRRSPRDRSVGERPAFM